MSDGRLFFGRRSAAFFAPFFWGWVAASSMAGRKRGALEGHSQKWHTESGLHGGDGGGLKQLRLLCTVIEVPWR